MRKIKDPRIGFVTVTDVELSEDLKNARVFVSVMSAEDREPTLEALNASRGFVRSEVGRRIRMKFTPDVTFRIDKSVEHGQRVDELLRAIEEHREDTGRPDQVSE